MFDVLSRIKVLREQKGWSVYKLAKLSGYLNQLLLPGIKKIYVLL